MFVFLWWRERIQLSRILRLHLGLLAKIGSVGSFLQSGSKEARIDVQVFGGWNSLTNFCFKP